MQDLYTMMIFNEPTLAARVGNQNINKYKEVLDMKNMQSDKSNKVLVTVT